VEVKLQALAPGLVQQVQQRCSGCGGAGSRAPPAADRCRKCGGSGLVQESKTFEVHIGPQHRHGSKVVMRGEAGTAGEAGVLPGDLIFLLDQRPHPTFKRVGLDLFCEKKVRLGLEYRWWVGSRLEPKSDSGFADPFGVHWELSLGP
jgi:DnaJ-class molecular chaperone